MQLPQRILCLSKKALYIWLLLFPVIGCTDKKTIEVLLEAKGLMENYPDSALYLLERFNKNEIDDMSDRNQAYYYLALTEIKDKKEESLLPVDSLLDKSIRYFEKRDKKQYAKTLYYKGRIWSKLNEPQKTITCFHTGISLLENTQEYEELAKINNALGGFYIDQDLFQEALNSFKKAIDYSELSNNKVLRFTSTRNAGVANLFLEQMDSTYHYYQEALEYAHLMKDSIKFINTIYNNLSIYYRIIEDYENSFKFINKISETDNKTLLLKGNLYLETNQYDSARHYLDLCAQNKDIYIQTSSSLLLYHLEENLENYKAANNYLIKYKEGEDSINTLTQTSEIHAINHKHNIQVTVTKLKHQYSMRTAWITIFSLIIISTLIIIYTYRDKEKKIKQKNQEKEILEKEKEISNLELQIATTRNSILRIQQENNDFTLLQTELQSQINILQTKIFMMRPYFKRINELGDEKKGKNLKVLTEKEKNELREELYSVFADFIEDLRIKCSALTPDDILFCCLSKLNLPLISISLCIGSVDTAPAKQRKYRIKKKMTEETNNLDLYQMIFEESESN